MGLVIDVFCDLLQVFIEEYDIVVMLIVVKIDKDVFKDNCDLVEIQCFFDLKMGSCSYFVFIELCLVEDVQKLFLEKFVFEKDCVFCFIIIVMCSLINDYVIKVSFVVFKYYCDVCDQIMMFGLFLMWVIDMCLIFVGFVLVIVEVVWLFKIGQMFVVICE